MKIVLAGGTGLVGTRLTKHLLDSGHSVIVLSRTIPPPASYAPASLNVVKWDGRSGGAWHQHVDGADAIVNFSGASLGTGRWTAARKMELISSRIEPTSAIVDAIRAAHRKPRVFLSASAVGYYGPVDGETVTEARPSGNDFLSKLCVEWERVALQAEQSGVRTVLLRSGIVLDPAGGALKKMILPFMLFAGGPLGSGTQWLPWIHREDEIRAICFLIDHDIVSGPVNLASPEGTTMRMFSSTLGNMLRRPSFIRVPAFALKMSLGEMAGMILTGQRVVPDKLERAGFTFRFPKLPEALEDLLVQRVTSRV